MPPKPTWDITNRSDSANIRRILADLRRTEVVPLDALEALEALLTRAESAERHQVARATGQRAAQVMEVTHKGYDRTVGLIEHTLVCRVCNRTETAYRYPGAVPTVCDRDECQDKASRQDNAERQRRWRARHKAQDKGDDRGD